MNSLSTINYLACTLICIFLICDVHMSLGQKTMNSESSKKPIPVHNDREILKNPKTLTDNKNNDSGLKDSTLPANPIQPMNEQKETFDQKKDPLSRFPSMPLHHQNVDSILSSVRPPQMQIKTNPSDGFDGQIHFPGSPLKMFKRSVDEKLNTDKDKKIDEMQSTTLSSKNNDDMTTSCKATDSTTMKEEKNIDESTSTKPMMDNVQNTENKTQSSAEMLSDQSHSPSPIDDIKNKTKSIVDDLKTK